MEVAHALVKSEAAVGGDDLSRDPARAGPEQIGRDGRDVFRKTEPARWPTTALGVDVVEEGEAAQRVGVDRAAANHVDRDARRELGGEIAHGGFERTLRRADRRVARHDAPRAETAKRNDARAVDEDRLRARREGEQPAEMSVPGDLP